MSDTVLTVLITSVTTLITTLIGAYVKVRYEAVPASKPVKGSRVKTHAKKTFKLKWWMILAMAALVGLITFLIGYQIGKTPKVVVDTENLTGWTPDFNRSKGNPTLNAISLAPGKVDNGIQLSYDLGESGYDILTKNINPHILPDTKGIRFYYKGSGAGNTIEFKLMLRFPGDTEDTTYGILLPEKTETGADWIYEEVHYSDMNCWWPAELCKLHGNTLDLSAVLRMDFAVSNKPERNDTAGSGWVTFDEVKTIE